MRFATFTHQGRRLVGQVSADGRSITALDLPAAHPDRGMLSMIEQVASGGALPNTTGAALPLDSVKLVAPIPVPRRNVWCVGRNYHAHAQELQASVFKNNAADPTSWPIFFTKALSTQIDYEAELTIVIGKGGKNIPRDKAMEHVFGYTIVNDVTSRDVQMRHQQWDLGKSFDTFCPMGPWIVTADELDGRNTRVRCWVNGELRQDALTTDLIFDLPSLIETASRGITLYPGDLIATGSPAGVGMGMTPPSWLKAGDSVRIAIDGLGEIENRFVNA
jgi:2-keto-4-pentenoate hydratase/2-oxohepta-3-ene-1,7-dioic acid hydratase in catechol pathway